MNSNKQTVHTHDPLAIFIGYALYAIALTLLFVNMLARYRAFYDIGINATANSYTLMFFVAPTFFLGMVVATFGVHVLVKRLSRRRWARVLMSILIPLLVFLIAFLAQVRKSDDYPGYTPKHVSVFLLAYFGRDVLQISTDSIQHSQRTVMQFPSLHLTMEVPEEIVVQEENEDAVSLCIAGSVNTSYPGCIRISAIDEVLEDFRDWQKVPLHTQGTLYYTIEFIIGANGRKPVHLTALKGYIILNNRRFRILASGHNKYKEPDVTWCVPFLQTIRDEKAEMDDI